jgi:hypothetical protein
MSRRSICVALGKSADRMTEIADGHARWMANSRAIVKLNLISTDRT